MACGDSSRPFRYRLVPVASYLIPERALRFLGRHWQLDRDPADGWTYWLDVSYWRYVRRDRKRNPDLYAEGGTSS